MVEIKELQSSGLSFNESKIYLILIKSGSLQAGEISKQTQVNRSVVYDCIQRLLEKGLVTFVIESKRKLFRPAAPEKLLARARDQQKIIEKIVPELNSLYKTSKEKEDLNIYKGRKGIKSIMHDVLKVKEYVSFGSSGEFLDIMKHDFHWFQNMKKKLKIKSRVILSEALREKDISKKAAANIRFISDKYSTPSTTWIFNDKVAIVLWSQNPTAVVIDSSKVAKSYRSYFELLWKVSKK